MGAAARLGIALLVTLGAAACMPVGPVEQEVPAAPMPGPNLVLDVNNASDRDLTVGYEFEGLDSSGGGEGSAFRCERSVIPLALIQGNFEILVDGATVLVGAVPFGLPDESWLVVRIQVGADGTTEVIGPIVQPRMPELFSRPLAVCG